MFFVAKIHVLILFFTLSQENGYLVMTEPSEQVDKVIQLYETMLTRHTTMVVGPTGGGKSVIIQTLSRAQTKLGKPTKLFIINPKAQPTSELYGLMGKIILLLSAT
jgi:dynein heavy chain